MNLQALLLALSMVESGCNDRAIGKLGEVSRYQIKPALWKTYYPLRDATNHKLSSEVATALLRQTAKQLDTDSILLICAGYNYGTWRILRADKNFSRLPARVRDYALRVYNLYSVYDKLHIPSNSGSLPLSGVVLSPVRTHNTSSSGKVPSSSKVGNSTKQKHGNSSSKTARLNQKSKR